MIGPVVIWFVCGFLCVIGAEAWLCYGRAKEDHSDLSRRDQRILGLMRGYIFFKMHPAETLFLSFFGPVYLLVLAFSRK